MAEIAKLYNNTLILTRNQKHMYFIAPVEAPENKTYVPGITTILRVLAKPALEQWKINTAIDYLRAILMQGQTITGVDLEGARTQHLNVSTDAANRGKGFHAWINLFVQRMIAEELPPELPKQADLNKMAQRFIKWVESEDVEFLASEKFVYSVSFGIAGQYDVKLRMRKKHKDTIFIGDWKTLDMEKAGDAVYFENFLQLAFYAYADAEEAMVSDSAKVSPQMFADVIAAQSAKRILVRIDKTGDHDVVGKILPEETFVADLASVMGAGGIYGNPNYKGGRE